MIKEQKIKIESGFTLIELVVVIAIVILLLILYIPSYRRFALKDELRMGIQQMKEGILHAQGLAFAPQYTHQDSNQDSNKKLTYYRFIFYPGETSDESPIKYEIRAGDYNLEDLDCYSSSSATGSLPNWEDVFETLPFETGYLPENIRFLGPTNKLREIDGKKQGTIIFKLVDGKCFYNWEEFCPTPPTAPPKYTFKNEATSEQASVILNLVSCQVEIEIE